MNPDSEEETPSDVAATPVDDPVDEMVEESFPASDPPSGWAGEDPRDLAVAVDHEAPAADAD